MGTAGPHLSHGKHRVRRKAGTVPLPLPCDMARPSSNSKPWFTLPVGVILCRNHRALNMQLRGGKPGLSPDKDYNPLHSPRGKTEQSGCPGESSHSGVPSPHPTPPPGASDGIPQIGGEGGLEGLPMNSPARTPPPHWCSAPCLSIRRPSPAENGTHFPWGGADSQGGVPGAGLLSTSVARSLPSCCHRCLHRLLAVPLPYFPGISHPRHFRATGVTST